MSTPVTQTEEPAEPQAVHPRLKRLQDTFSQDWEVYNVLTSPLQLTTYVELETVCNTEDLYNMYEIVQANKEMEHIARITAKLNEGNK